MSALKAAVSIFVKENWELSECQIKNNGKDFTFGDDVDNNLKSINNYGRRVLVWEKSGPLERIKPSKLMWLDAQNFASIC